MSTWICPGAVTGGAEHFDMMGEHDGNGEVIPGAPRRGLGQWQILQTRGALNLDPVRLLFHSKESSSAKTRRLRYCYHTT